ncbi:MAG: GNAT family N-acetyltransferase, partial [Rubrivivax sp.]|nr:GNAT family N-acetyltransferase [Rubrivivax sp.]
GAGPRGGLAGGAPAVQLNVGPMRPVRLRPVHLRSVQERDLRALAALYAAAARTLGPAVYTPRQVQAWAAFADDGAAFRDYVLQPDTWVALAGGEGDDDGGAPVGFSGWQPIAGTPDGEIRSLYVRPDLGRRGVGTQLLAASIARARQAGAAALWAWVTPLSRPLFERAGFVLVQTVHEDFAGVPFERYRVRRPAG